MIRTIFADVAPPLVNAMAAGLHLLTEVGDPVVIDATCVRAACASAGLASPARMQGGGVGRLHRLHARDVDDRAAAVALAHRRRVRQALEEDGERVPTARPWRLRRNAYYVSRAESCVCLLLVVASANYAAYRGASDLMKQFPTMECRRVAAGSHPQVMGGRMHALRTSARRHAFRR